MVKYILVSIFETLLRFFPMPCKTGLREFGNPGPDSPVFLTCNYHLTVERVKRALKGMDCYLLVANSRGINVWCGAAGGHLNNHRVVSVLKTSGIEERVNHRSVILPQLAGPGVEPRAVRKKAGWSIIWGPVYAKDIPAFMEKKGEKNQEMRGVKFPPLQRIEMAVMWAFPLSVTAGLLTSLFWPRMNLSLNVFIWVFSFFVFLAFPLYSKWLLWRKFEFLRVSAFLWGTFLVGLLVYSVLLHSFDGKFWLWWGVVSLLVICLLSVDLAGSTPVYKSGLHEDRFFKVVLDKNKCRAAGCCEQVCPRNCFEVDRSHHTARMPRASQCVQCGACIVQCPFDALWFENQKGEKISPETIRKFKLNLMGQRALGMD
ncbi:MAG: copper oxidase [Candidatus Aminicenantes bacterium]|nr:copper oxidase [Candidatus Aminicenantes bacterium]